MEDKVVLHVMGMDSSKYGGIERFNVELARMLWSRGYKGVFVYESEPASRDFVKDMENAKGEIIVLCSRKKRVRFCRAFAKLLKKYQPVLVHAHFTKARFFAVPIAYFMGFKKLFFTIHGEMDPKKLIKPHTRLWYYWANKKAKVIAVSDNIVSSYKTNWPDSKIQRIYLGVRQIKGERRESRVKLGMPQDQMVLLSVSNFNHIKGLDVLCSAVKLLKDRGVLNDLTCLYIVGQPEKDKEELEKLIEKLEIQPYIRMMGISNDVPDYMVSADLYIQASRSEGLPLALMEASSSALPLVGTKVGGIPEVVRDGYNGMLVDSENAEMLADAIGKLIQEASLRHSYGENSLMVYQQNFSVEQGVVQTLGYYDLDN